MVVFVMIKQMEEIIILPAAKSEAATIRKMSLSHLTLKQKAKYLQVADARNKHFNNMILGKNGICFVAHINNEVVGYVVGGAKEPPLTSIKYAELENVFVLPGFRNLGIATKLCFNFIDWANAQGYERISVKTGWKNQKDLLPFYEKLGFKPLAIELEQ
jgi:GNAT superfamily N-acetyltransferase